MMNFSYWQSQDVSHWCGNMRKVQIDIWQPNTKTINYGTVPIYMAQVTVAISLTAAVL